MTTQEREPKEPSFETGQEALIYEVERACGQLNKLKDLQLDEPFLRAVAADIRAHMDHLGKLAGVNGTLRLVTVAKTARACKGPNPAFGADVFNSRDCPRRLVYR